MFLTYLMRELRRRNRQAIVVAVGLAIGIGLVVTVSAASAGVKSAQTQVLHSLYGVGTDMTVTQTPSASTTGPSHFAFGGGGANGARPTPGSSFHHTRIRPAFGLSRLSEARVAQIGKLKDVSVATGGLSLTETSVSGTLPSFGSGGGPSGAPSGGPPSGLNVNSTSLAGVEPTSTGVGPLSPSEISKGTYFQSSDPGNVAIVSSSYASQHSLKIGSSVSLDGTKFKVIGIAAIPSSTSSTDVYLPLGAAQKLAGLGAEVTTVYVSVNSSSNVSRVQSEIRGIMPKATVTTSADLASEVTGSLSNAANLASDLGKWLAIAVLLAAFLVASLLMLSAVSRRVREFGTLKAIGWRTRRIMEQVMGEGLVLGIAGAVIGVVLGLVGSELVSAFAPTLSATVAPPTASAGAGGFNGGGGFPGRFAGGGGFPGRFGGSGFRPSGFANRLASSSHTVLVHLTAPLQGGTVGLAIGLAIIGGLLAGAVGSWRAARMRPAEALRQVG